MFRKLRLFLAPAALTGLAAHAAAQLANQPPAPQWILAASPPASIEKRFEHRGKLLKAILLCATEAPAEIILNGRPAGRIEPGAQAVSLDVTALVHEGDNLLQIKVGPGRVAALLELNGDLAAKTWLASDATWTRAGGAAGVEPVDPKANPFDFSKTFDAYNSWQLAKPGAQSAATGASSVLAPAGFKVELLRSAAADEGSWVAMAFDPERRITLAREKRGLLRLDPKSGAVEVIDDTLLECRGLVYADRALIASANNSKGLYRLRDADGDGKFEEVRELVHSEGGVGHGRNHVKLGPDGSLWVAHGNNVLLPRNVSSASPLRNYAVDQLLPNPWDDTMFDGSVELPAGHVLRVSADGGDVQLIAGGFRNPLDGAFNRAGEFFVFDADMERDVGASWYMPTRVLHVVPGADYGWRRGTGRYPAWYADTLPSVVDVGLSSPTGVFFGYGAKFPERYQEALFILDWAYGRIIAVTLRPRGASWVGEQETFVSGRPLNVTDGCIGPDGAMWFITGGRGTQSGLYRVTWPGAAEPAAAPSGLTEAQKLRRRIEDGRASDEEIEAGLASADPFLRHAAVLIAEQRAGGWHVEELDAHRSGWSALSRWLVAVRSGRPDLREKAMAMAIRMPWKNAPVEQRLAALRTLGIGVARAGGLPAALADEARAVFEPRFPSNDQRLDRELCRLLVHLKSPEVIAKSTVLLKSAVTSEDLVFYPLHLRYLKEDWTLDQRRIVFDALNRAEKLNGASAYFKAIADTRSDLAAALTPEEAKDLAPVIFIAKPVELAPHALPGHTFRQWKLADLAPMLEKASKGRSYERAKASLVTTQCVFCHRVGNDPSLPAGLFGPDLSQVSARFGRRDLLMHILEPSLVIDDKFRSTVVTTADGRQASGFLDREDDERVVLKPNPLAPDVVEIGKAQIRERKLSDVSPMPPGLLNSLKADQILDMLAWFETGGDPARDVWAK